MDRPALPPVEVPLSALNPETLMSIIESFVQREGTDYGRNEIEFETKVKQVHGQLLKGHIKLVFDPNTESVTILTKQQWQQLTTPL